MTTERDRWQTAADAAKAARDTFTSAGGYIIHKKAWEALRVGLQANADSYPALPEPLTAGVLVSGMDHMTPRADIAAAYSRAAAVGALWVRTDLWWYSTEVASGVWDWDYADALVEETESRGLQLIPILQGTPLWLAGSTVSPPPLARWETFVRAVVARYRGRVLAWEVWNEPDATVRWAGTASQYAALLARAAAVIRAEDPMAKVWMGGLALGGPTARPTFFADCLADPANPMGPSTDVVNVHVNFMTMTQVADTIQAHRAQLNKPVVVTEASYTSDPTYQWVPGYTGGAPDQARYLTDVYGVMADAGVTVGVWAALDDGPPENAEYAENGLYTMAGQPKAAWAAFQAL